MAEEVTGLLGTLKVADASQDGKLQPQPPMQEEKHHSRKDVTKKTTTKKTCHDKGRENGESYGITLPVGCKISPKGEPDIVLQTNNVMESLKAIEMPGLPGDYSILQQFQVYQNVSVNGLKGILENTCKLIREGHQNSPELFAFLCLLSWCCSTSAAVRRALSFPGIVPLLKGFIDTYLIAFINTPFLKSGKLGNLANSLAFMMTIIGRFMAFSKPPMSDDLLTWWKAIDKLYEKRSWSSLSNVTLRRAMNNDVDGLEVVSSSFIVVSTSMKQMQATRPPQPCEILKPYNAAHYYVVFCCSLQCPVFAERDGVLLLCACCKLAAYCSRQCQKAHWKLGHKENCWKITWDFDVRI